LKVQKPKSNCFSPPRKKSADAEQSNCIKERITGLTLITSSTNPITDKGIPERSAKYND
jgi:hypothetical protein